MKLFEKYRQSSDSKDSPSSPRRYRPRQGGRMNNYKRVIGSFGAKVLWIGWNF